MPWLEFRLFPIVHFQHRNLGRLASLTNNLSGTANDLSATFAYNPASQIASIVRTGDAYAWTGHFNTNVTGTANGLNQLTSVGPKSLTHDSKGNVTAFGTKGFTYSSENLLLTGPGSTTLNYDPSMRLYQSVSGGTTQRMAYDGLDRIAEYNGANALQRRYVHGPGTDEPIVWYEGSGTTDRRFLSSDERGSIISLTDSGGALLGINKYDEYGNTQAGNLGAFGYTGQAWLPGPAIWYYKARVYDPESGRFLQTDPIAVEGGLNLYAYVGNDPINWIDPLGLTGVIVVEAPLDPLSGRGAFANSLNRLGQRFAMEARKDFDDDVIVVVGRRIKVAGNAADYIGQGNPNWFLNWYVDNLSEGAQNQKNEAEENIDQLQDWLEECGSKIDGAEAVIAAAKSMWLSAIYGTAKDTIRGKPPKTVPQLGVKIAGAGILGSIRNIGSQADRKCR